MKVKHITIIGLGLIGGSLGLAFKDKGGVGVSITGIDQDPYTLEKAIECGAVDYSTNDLAKGVNNADIIFLCTPVLQILPIVEKMVPYLKTGTILTDVGSTKGFLAERLAVILPAGIHYVSGHPMTGGEQSGITAANKDLFKDKWYIIVPKVSSSPEVVDTICEALKWTGARITTMDVIDHDQCASIISHVPHIAAAALVNLLALYPHLDDELKLVGGGFKDTTRIASSNADMWADICLTNAQPITDSLLHFQTLLEEVVAAIKAGDRQGIHQFFEKAKIRRDALMSKTDSHTIF